MSLRSFHLVFIAAAILLTLSAGMAMVVEFERAKDFGQLIAGLGFLVMGAALGIYCPSIWRRFKTIDRDENL